MSDLGVINIMGHVSNEEWGPALLYVSRKQLVMVVTYSSSVTHRDCAASTFASTTVKARPPILKPSISLLTLFATPAFFSLFCFSSLSPLPPFTLYLLFIALWQHTPFLSLPTVKGVCQNFSRDRTQLSISRALHLSLLRELATYFTFSLDRVQSKLCADVHWQTVRDE